MHDLNRRLGYKKGRSTPIYAALGNPFRHYLASYGLQYQDALEPANALPHLRQLVASPTTSLPLVSVGLGFTEAADSSTEVVGRPSDEDHLIVILALDSDRVEFFDPAAHPEVHGEVQAVESAPLGVFTRFWGGYHLEPYLRAWVERVPPPPARAKGKATPKVHPLEDTYPSQGGQNR